MYDLTSPITDYSYHGMGVRNVLAGINDYHGGYAVMHCYGVCEMGLLFAGLRVGRH